MSVCVPYLSMSGSLTALNARPEEGGQAKRNHDSPHVLGFSAAPHLTHPCTVDFMANFLQFILAVSEEIPADRKSVV